MKPDSKDISWKYVTGDEKLTEGPCELLYAYLVVSAASTDSAIYNGSGTNGTLIVGLKSAAVTGHEFKPPRPIYCDKGLYVDVGTNVSGIFVQWRNL